MPRIRVLDEATANQIAAGEVVERPSSVVKELVENSLDAGSTRIIVEIKGGGMQLIRVIDNGSGMDESDSAIAFQRHATSKIKSLADIENICSLGFRGEALPSIASVSKIEMVTRSPESDSGTRLVMEGGRLLSQTPVGCPPGTSITVTDLFFNTPARLKYMKTKSTEAGQISDIMSRLALTRPDVSIKLVSEGRTSFHTPGTGNAVDALSAVYGAETARNLIRLEEREEDSMAVRGYVCPPSLSRSTRRNITVIINGRYVRNYLISTAIIEGYGTLIPHGRFPIALIYIEISPEILDVNVHPSKMVVRVSGESGLFNLVRRTVTATLRTERVIPGLDETKEITAYHHEYRPLNTAHFKLFERGPVTARETLTQGSLTAPDTPQSRPHTAGTDTLTNSVRDCGQSGPGAEYFFDSAYPIGFLPPTYILAGSARGLLIIDHHAAHERILYEKFLKTLAGESVDVQILLVPLALSVSPHEYRAAEEFTEYFSSLGISLEGLEPGSIIIREIPSGLSRQSAEEIIRDLLEYIIESGRKIQREDMVKKLAASAACREAVKSGTRSTIEEARALIEQLKKAEAPYTCPHGRPTIIAIGEQELKSRFKRT